MDDRTLLEMAARAAGIAIEWTEGNKYLPRGWYDRDSGHPWDALTDDGDALRLAVALGICFGPNLDGDRAVAYGNDGRNIVEPYGTDPYAATRRAIVRAAAQIGRTGSGG